MPIFSESLGYFCAKKLCTHVPTWP